MIPSSRPDTLFKTRYTNQQRYVTGAATIFTVDHTGGAIYANFMMSSGEGARTTWRREPKREERPPLCQFCDVMWSMEYGPTSSEHEKYEVLLLMGHTK
jgi:hypothetical protein